MANLDEKKAREELQQGKTRAVYYFVSEDPFKLEYFSGLAKKSQGSQLAAEIFYGDELDPVELLESANTSTLWHPHKLILVRQAERITAKSAEALLPMIESPPERSTLIFLSSKADARTKFIQSLGKSKEQAAIVRLGHAEAGEWNLWVQSFLKDVGKTLSDDAREILQQWTLGSLSELKHALERAALFAGGAPEIQLDHVRAVAFRVSPEEAYSFSAHILSGNLAQSLVKLDVLLSQGEEPIALVGLLARQYRWLLSILALRAEGQGDAAIASACRIYPNAARALFPASRRLGGEGVVSGLAALAQTDFGLKSSRVPVHYLMTNLLIELTRAP